MRTRKKDRRKVELSGQCSTVDGRLFDIGVRDLTDEGCRFGDDDPPLGLGSMVKLTIGGAGPFTAYVRWSARGEVGVSFAQPFTAEQVEILVNRDHAGLKPAAPADATSRGATNAPGKGRDDDPGLPLRSVC